MSGSGNGQQVEDAPVSFHDEPEDFETAVVRPVRQHLSFRNCCKGDPVKDYWDRLEKRFYCSRKEKNPRKIKKFRARRKSKFDKRQAHERLIVNQPRVLSEEEVMESIEESFC